MLHEQIRQVERQYSSLACWGRDLVKVWAEVATPFIAVGHPRCANSRGYSSFLGTLQEPGWAQSPVRTIAAAVDAHTLSLSSLSSAHTFPRAALPM